MEERGNQKSNAVGSIFIFFKIGLVCGINYNSSVLVNHLSKQLDERAWESEIKCVGSIFIFFKIGLVCVSIRPGILVNYLSK